MKDPRIKQLLEQTFKEVSKSQIKEGSEVAIADLQNEVQRHVTGASEALRYASEEIYQLFKISEEIKMDWPDTSQQISSQVEPMLETLEGWPNMLKKLAQTLR